MGGGVSYQSICGSRTPSRTMAVRAADLGLKYDSKSVLSSSWTTVINVWVAYQLSLGARGS